jgi:hypothetical protein
MDLHPSPRPPHLHQLCQIIVDMKATHPKTEVERHLLVTAYMRSLGCRAWGLGRAVV